MSKIISNNKSKTKNFTTANGELNQISTKLGKITDLLAKAKFLDREEGLSDAYDKYSRDMMSDYIYGLYHPDVVFHENLDIKSPSYLPIPTTNFRFKESMTINTNGSGNFCLIWEPNFLGTESVMSSNYPGTDGTTKRVYGNITINNSDELSGIVNLETGWRTAIFRNVQQDFSKYRLTSACIKVRYTGKVIDQSGMFAASASYRDAFRTIMFKPDDYNEPFYNLPEVVRKRYVTLGDFDNIRQGQWALTTSVIDEPQGITCVYVPTDPLNQVFVNNATTIDSTLQSITNIDGDYNVYSWLTKNANISYCICGYSLPAYLNCITIETYYNYEIIVNQEQMPYFNPKVPNRNLMRYSSIVQGVSGLVSSSGLITHTKDHDKTGVFNKLRNAFRNVKNLYTEYYPVISTLVKALV